MKVLEIEGAKPLSGSINIGGAKNSAVALIPACILSNNLTFLEKDKKRWHKATKSILPFPILDTF